MAAHISNFLLILLLAARTIGADLTAPGGERHPGSAFRSSVSCPKIVTLVCLGVTDVTRLPHLVPDGCSVTMVPIDSTLFTVLDTMRESLLLFDKCSHIDNTRMTAYLDNSNSLMLVYEPVGKPFSTHPRVFNLGLTYASLSTYLMRTPIVYSFFSFFFIPEEHMDGSLSSLLFDEFTSIGLSPFIFFYQSLNDITRFVAQLRVYRANPELPLFFLGEQSFFSSLTSELEKDNFSIVVYAFLLNDPIQSFVSFIRFRVRLFSLTNAAISDPTLPVSSSADFVRYSLRTVLSTLLLHWNDTLEFSRFQSLLNTLSFEIGGRSYSFSHQLLQQQFFLFSLTLAGAINTEPILPSSAHATSGLIRLCQESEVAKPISVVVMTHITLNFTPSFSSSLSMFHTVMAPLNLTCYHLVALSTIGISASMGLKVNALSPDVIFYLSSFPITAIQFSFFSPNCVIFVSAFLSRMESKTAMQIVDTAPVSSQIHKLLLNWMSWNHFPSILIVHCNLTAYHDIAVSFYNALHLITDTSLIIDTELHSILNGTMVFLVLDEMRLMSMSSIIIELFPAISCHFFSLLPFRPEIVHPKFSVEFFVYSMTNEFTLPFSNEGRIRFGGQKFSDFETFFYLSLAYFAKGYTRCSAVPLAGSISTCIYSSIVNQSIYVDQFKLTMTRDHVSTQVIQIMAQQNSDTSVVFKTNVYSPSSSSQNPVFFALVIPDSNSFFYNENGVYEIIRYVIDKCNDSPSSKLRFELIVVRPELIAMTDYKSISYFIITQTSSLAIVRAHLLPNQTIITISGFAEMLPTNDYHIYGMSPYTYTTILPQLIINYGHFPIVLVGPPTNTLKLIERELRLKFYRVSLFPRYDTTQSGQFFLDQIRILFPAGFVALLDFTYQQILGWTDSYNKRRYNNQLYVSIVLRTSIVFVKQFKIQNIYFFDTIDIESEEIGKIKAAFRSIHKDDPQVSSIIFAAYSVINYYTKKPNLTYTLTPSNYFKSDAGFFMLDDSLELRVLSMYPLLVIPVIVPMESSFYILNWKDNPETGIIPLREVYNAGVILDSAFSSNKMITYFKEIIHFYSKYYFSDVYFNLTYYAMDDIPQLVDDPLFKSTTIFFGREPEDNNYDKISSYLSKGQLFMSLFFYGTPRCDDTVFNVGVSSSMITSAILQFLPRFTGRIVIIYENHPDAISVSKELYKFLSVYRYSIFIYTLIDRDDEIPALMKSLVDKGDVVMISCLPAKSLIVWSALMNLSISLVDGSFAVIDVFTEENMLTGKHRSFFSKFSNVFFFIFSSFTGHENVISSSELFMGRTSPSFFLENRVKKYFYSRTHGSVDNAFVLLYYIMDTSNSEHTFPSISSSLYGKTITLRNGPAAVDRGHYLRFNVFLANYVDDVPAVVQHDSHPAVYCLLGPVVIQSCASRFKPFFCHTIPFIMEDRYIQRETIRYITILFMKMVLDIQREMTDRMCVYPRILPFFNYTSKDLLNRIHQPDVFAIIGCSTEQCRSLISSSIEGKDKLFYYIGWVTHPFCSRNTITIQNTIPEKLAVFMRHSLVLRFSSYVIVQEIGGSTDVEHQTVRQYMRKNHPTLSFLGDFFYTDNLPLDLPQETIIINLIHFPSLESFVLTKTVSLNSIQLLMFFYRNSNIKSRLSQIENTYYVTISNRINDLTSSGYNFIISNALSTNDLNMFFYGIYMSVNDIFTFYSEMDRQILYSDWYSYRYYTSYTRGLPLKDNFYMINMIGVHLITLSSSDEMIGGVIASDSLLNRSSLVCDFSPSTKKLSIEWSLQITVWSIMGLLEAAIVTITILLRVHRRAYVLKAASLPFLYVILLGMALLVASGILTAFEPDRMTICISRVVLVVVGLNLVLVFLFLKSWRIYRLFNNEQQRKLLISNRRLFSYGSLFLAIQMVYLILWQVMFPSRPELMKLSKDYDTYMASVCSSNPYFLAVEIVFFLLLLLYGISIAWRTRNVKVEFNESFGIFLCVTVIHIPPLDPALEFSSCPLTSSPLIIACFIIPVSLILRSNPTVYTFLFESCICIIIICIICTIYGKPMFLIIFSNGYSSSGKSDRPASRGGGKIYGQSAVLRSRACSSANNSFILDRTTNR